MSEPIKKLMTNNIALLIVLAEIQDMCIGNIAMGYSLDAEYIGSRISQTTGMTKPELEQYILEHELDYPGF